MPRVLAVAYDVGPASPAQPRVAALLREFVRRGSEVWLWTERDPGPWAAELAAGGRLRVVVVADPVARGYARLLRRRRPRVPSPTGTAAPRSPSSAGGMPAWVWRLGARLQQALLFPDNQVLWSRRVARLVGAEVRAGDLVLTCSRPESVGCIGPLVQRRGARWWLDFADGWCFQGLRREAMTPGRRRDRECALERRWVGAADLVSTVDDLLAESFGRLRQGREVAVLPNLVPDEFGDRQPDPSPTPLPGDALPALGYFGRISLSDPERTLEPLLRLLRSDGGRRRARFCFHGEYRAEDRREIAAIGALGHEVSIADPLPRERLVAQRRAFAAMVVVTSPGQRGSSSKLLDALGLALPVLAIVPEGSIAARIVRECGCGMVVPFEALGHAEGLWALFLEGVRLGRYRLEPGLRERYTSAAFVPALVDRAFRMVGAAENPR
jgi:hypothetical protein